MFFPVGRVQQVFLAAIEELWKKFRAVDNAPDRQLSEYHGFEGVSACFYEVSVPRLKLRAKKDSPHVCMNNFSMTFYHVDILNGCELSAL
jgi:hypothetical protein